MSELSTLEKEEEAKKKAQDDFEQSTVKSMSDLFIGLKVKAQGSVFLMKKVKHGEGKNAYHKTETVKNEQEILDFFNDDLDDSNNEYHFIVTKDPDVRAAEILLNRAFGRPKEKQDTANKNQTIQAFNYIVPEKVEMKKVLNEIESPIPEPPKEHESDAKRVHYDTND